MVPPPWSPRSPTPSSRPTSPPPVPSGLTAPRGRHPPHQRKATVPHIIESSSLLSVDQQHDDRVDLLLRRLHAPPLKLARDLPCEPLAQSPSASHRRSPSALRPCSALDASPRARARPRRVCPPPCVAAPAPRLGRVPRSRPGCAPAPPRVARLRLWLPPLRPLAVASPLPPEADSPRLCGRASWRPAPDPPPVPVSPYGPLPSGAPTHAPIKKEEE